MDSLIELLHLVSLQVHLKREQIHGIFNMFLVFHQMRKCLFPLL